MTNERKMKAAMPAKIKASIHSRDLLFFADYFASFRPLRISLDLRAGRGSASGFFVFALAVDTLR